MTGLPPFDEAEYRRRQKARARLMAICLASLVVLIFFVTIAKMQFLAP